MFAFFPYLKTSGRFAYRSVLLTAPRAAAGLPPDASQELADLSQMFFLRDHKRIQSVSVAFLADGSSSERQAAFRADLAELRQLLAYRYSAPHETSGEPFLLNEHSSCYLILRQDTLHGVFGPQEGTEDALPPAYPAGEHRFAKIRAFAVELDGKECCGVTTGSRIYPPCSHLWLNISQDIVHDMERAETGDVYSAVLQYFAHRRESTRLHGRLLSALTWFNRSIGQDVADDVALVCLATAFECLLGLERGDKISNRFRETVLLLIGHTEQADVWVDQFYEARSRIVHQGVASTLHFQPRDKKPQRTVDAGYRSLHTYGVLIFHACAAAVASSALVAKSYRLETFLVSNAERLDKIIETLGQKKLPAEGRMKAISQNVIDCEHYKFESDPNMTFQRLLVAAKLCATCFLETNMANVECRNELEAVSHGTDTDESEVTLPALHRIRLLQEALERHSWETRHDSPTKVIVAALIGAVWHYTFVRYFQLEREARQDAEDVAPAPLPDGG